MGPAGLTAYLPWEPRLRHGGWAAVKANLALSSEVKPHQEVQDVGEELVFAQHLRQGSGSPRSSTGLKPPLGAVVYLPKKPS